MKTYATLIGLCLLLITTACRPSVREATVVLEGETADAVMEKMGAALAELTPSSEDEGLVLNHLQNLWHYIRVSSSTRITISRKSWARSGNHVETVAAIFDGGQIGSITVNAQDNDTADALGIDEGSIKFSEEVDRPEKGTGHGAFYPFGNKAGNQEVPPSFQLELPGGYFVPAGGLRDHRKRFMKHQAAIDVLQTICRDTADLGLEKVIFEQE